MRLLQFPTDRANLKWSAAFSQTLATYNPDATMADVTSTCIFPSEPYLNCQGACLNDSDGDGTCDEQEVPGCEDPSAANYNPLPTDDDGSCFIESAPGCLIPSATNYDPTVTVQGQPITSFCTFNFQNPPMISPPAVDCADSYACNYDNTASGYTECEYSSCLGCTVTSACNYDATAVYNDGSCEYTSCAGCTASGACNYDATASINDGSCEYTSCAGCTEPNADNYDATATIDDASCEYLGCTNISACNYGCADPAACAAAGESGPNTDDGSCEFTSCAGCMTSGACNYDATATISAACEYTSCAGCTDNTADNYDATATIDNGTCEFEGCTNGSACNYDATANVDDGSCTYAASGFDCDGNCSGPQQQQHLRQCRDAGTGVHQSRRVQLRPFCHTERRQLHGGHSLGQRHHGPTRRQRRGQHRARGCRQRVRRGMHGCFQQRSLPTLLTWTTSGRTMPC